MARLSDEARQQRCDNLSRAIRRAIKTEFVDEVDAADVEQVNGAVNAISMVLAGELCELLVRVKASDVTLRYAVMHTVDVFIAQNMEALAELARESDQVCALAAGDPAGSA
jgi:hypothetical protein